jgi:hypothetical protein
MALFVKGKKTCGRRGKNDASGDTPARDTAGVLVVYHAGLGDFNRSRFCAVLQAENG